MTPDLAALVGRLRNVHAWQEQCHEAAAAIESLAASSDNFRTLYGDAMENCRHWCGRAERAEAEKAILLSEFDNFIAISEFKQVEAERDELLGVLIDVVEGTPIGGDQGAAYRLAHRLIAKYRANPKT